MELGYCEHHMNGAKEVAEKNEFNRELCDFAIVRTSPLSMSTSCYLFFFFLFETTKQGTKPQDLLRLILK